MLFLAYLGLFPHLWTTQDLGEAMPSYPIFFFKVNFSKNKQGDFMINAFLAYLGLFPHLWTTQDLG